MLFRSEKGFCLPWGGTQKCSLGGISCPPPSPFSISPAVLDVDTEASSISNKTTICNSSSKLPLSLAKLFPKPLLYTTEILQLQRVEAGERWAPRAGVRLPFSYSLAL